MESDKDLKILRHSAAHLLAHAVLELYPKTILTIGPSTEEGFFYDFLPTTNFKEEDLEKIEAKMHEISNRNLKIEHKEISKAEAIKLYKDNQFKLELINDIPGDTVGISSQGDFFDLCKGGHVESTGEIKFFKLYAISGAYWRADRNNQALQRINGTAFYTEKDLKDHEQLKADLLKYDHRKIGKELDLFSFHEEGPGFVFYHPKGRTVINQLMAYMRKVVQEENFTEIATPIILSDELWKRSGHYSHYKDNMYFTIIDEKGYAIKPMNCPGSMLIYKNRPRSYKELPIKLSEFGLVHRHELSGVLHGLLRVRSFTQDDAHIYCRQNQIEDEILKSIRTVFRVMEKLGFEKIKVVLSTKPKDSMGSADIWSIATEDLKNALYKSGTEYEIAEGDGAFYGPKIDFKVEDSLKREWQLSTIQLDFINPINFDLSYVTSEGTKEKPVMIHRAVFGSLERTFAILLEHHKGNLPFFISPIQIKILTISDNQKNYAEQILNQLKENSLRAEIDESSDPISGKIKLASDQKVPWMIVIGKKEVESNTLTLRYHNGKQETGLKIEDIILKSKNFN